MGHSRALEHLPCTGLHCQISGTSDPGDLGKGMLESLPLVQQDWLREQQGKSDIHESMGPGGMHPEVLRMSRHHGEATHHHLWKVVATRRGARRKQMSPILQKRKGRPGKSWPVSLTSIPANVTECLILGTISVHMDDKKVIMSGQHGFTTAK